MTDDADLALPQRPRPPARPTYRDGVAAGGDAALKAITPGVVGAIDIARGKGWDAGYAAGAQAGADAVMKYLSEHHLSAPTTGTLTTVNRDAEGRVVSTTVQPVILADAP